MTERIHLTGVGMLQAHFLLHELLDPFVGADGIDECGVVSGRLGGAVGNLAKEGESADERAHGQRALHRKNGPQHHDGGEAETHDELRNDGHEVEVIGVVRRRLGVSGAGKIEAALHVIFIVEDPDQEP